jgi:hypothetical protein
VLEVGAVGARSALPERLGGNRDVAGHVVVLGDQPGVVVLDLVIVPRGDEREARVRGLQIRVAAILGVAAAVVVERHRLVADVAARSAVGRPILVDVVAEVNDEVDVLLGEVFVGCVEARLEVLARYERELHLPRLAPGRWERPCPADGAFLLSCPEPVPVPAIRSEIGHVDVNRMRERGQRHGHAPPHDVPQAGIRCQLPVDQNRLGRHPAAVERVVRQPRPEHDALVRGIS